MRRLLAWLIVLLPFAAMAQSVQQSGRVTPGHPTMWTTDGVVQDAGTPAQGGLTGLGITSSNLQSQCINNGPPTGPYNSLCFGINGTQAQITLSNFGGAPAIPLQCVVNGVTSNCLSTAGSFLQLSGGTLSGPLILSADPTLSLGAATKHYVDSSLPLGGPFLPLSGGTLTGPLIISGSLLITSISPSVTAAGTTQGTATILTSTTNIITTVGSGTGVEVPTGPVFVANRGANPLLIYPPSGSQIEKFGANNPVTLPVGSNTHIVCASIQCTVIQ